VEGLTLHDLASDVAGVIEALDGAPAWRPTDPRSFGVSPAWPPAAWCRRIPRHRRPFRISCGPICPRRPPVRRSARPCSPQARIPIAISPKADPSPGPARRPPSCSRRAAPPRRRSGWREGARRCFSSRVRTRIGERARLVEIPRAGHLLLQEQPEAVAKMILSFLRAH
jgi:hypothetical protein